MKENQLEETNEPQNNNIIIKTNKEKETSKHNTLLSSLPLKMEQKKSYPENVNGTEATTLGFLNNVKDEKKDTLSNLTKSTEKTEDTSNNNLKMENKAEKEETESFYQKTKRWAGSLWSYVNIKNYFPKTEYIEYRNCNGDMVKIPKKKIPLKKKRVEVTKEQYIVNKTFDRDNQKIHMNVIDNIPLASHFV